MLANKPVIGISAPLHPESRGYRVSHCYADAVAEAGGIPLMLPAAETAEDVDLLLPWLDGVLIPGGPDVDPLFYGEEPRQELGLVIHSNDVFEMNLLKAARTAHKPIFCVCRGVQILNVTFGGTLVQDIPSQLPGTLRHMQIPVDRTEPTHSVDIVKDTYLYKVFETDTILTNSFHHQCIQTVAPGFSVSAKARDGVIEAIEVKEEHILGVQWHPEEMVHAHPEHFGLFRQFVGAAAGAID